MSDTKAEVRFTYPNGHISTWECKTLEEAKTIARHRHRRMSETDRKNVKCELVTFMVVASIEYKL